MIKQLLIATTNAGKFAEITEVLRALPLELLSLKDVGISDDVEEHGVTHDENAIIKARFYYEKTKLPTIGEDSGIEVDAFPGELGVYTRRWKGMGKATDEQWVAKFLEEMQHLPPEKRGARFVCCTALILNDESYHAPKIFWGETRGIITPDLQAPLKPGIPISSCFLPVGSDKVYAALNEEEKNKISHRGKAMHKLYEYLTLH